jgi:hypothetical protein
MDRGYSFSDMRSNGSAGCRVKEKRYELKKSGQTAAFHFLQHGCQPAEMASTGQESVHAPQSVQVAGSMTN